MQMWWKNGENRMKKLIDLKWELLMIKVRIWSLELRVKTALRIFFNCRRGYHHISPKSLKIVNSRYDKKKKRRVEKCIINAHWLACRDCGTLFFKDKKEKQKYSNYQDKRNKQMNKIVDRIEANKVVKDES